MATVGNPLSNVVKLLPTGTVLAFRTLSPSFTKEGKCYPANQAMTSTLISLCALSCAIFSFTDSVIGEDGKLYHGIATFKGFYLFNYYGDEAEKSRNFNSLKKYKIRLLDFVHALFNELVFLALAFSDSNIQSCLFPDSGMELKELLVNLPLGTAVLSIMVFIIFPTTRRGIGYSKTSDTAQDEAEHSEVDAVAHSEPSDANAQSLTENLLKK